MHTPSPCGGWVRGGGLASGTEESPPPPPPVLPQPRQQFNSMPPFTHRNRRSACVTRESIARKCPRGRALRRTIVRRCHARPMRPPPYRSSFAFLGRREGVGAAVGARGPTRVLLSVRPTPPHGGGVGGWVWQNFRVGGCPTPPPPRVGWDFVGALGSIEPVPLLSFFCCRFRVTCLFMVCLHVIAYHVCMPHAHKGARMLCRLCWMRRGQP